MFSSSFRRRRRRRRHLLLLLLLLLPPPQALQPFKDLSYQCYLPSFHCLRPLPACCYSHYISSLQTSLSIFCVAFLFSLFLPLWLLKSVVAFFGFAFFHDHKIPVAGLFLHLPGTELRDFSMTVQSIEG